MKSSGKEKDRKVESFSASSFLEKVEWYIFLIGGATIWYFIVSLSFKWLQFPVHLHLVEVMLIYTIPIILIYFVMKVIDFVVEK